MPNVSLTDYKFFRMWPRDRFRKKDKKGRLLVKLLVKELQYPGVYVLYKGDELYYVGKTTKSLFGRLHSHSNIATDDYYAHWDYFSAFALVGPRKRLAELAFLEAILVAAMPRATNRKIPARLHRVKIPRQLLSD